MGVCVCVRVCVYVGVGVCVSRVSDGVGMWMERKERYVDGV